MKSFRWNEEKNEWLKEVRGISFDDIVDAIEQNNLVAIEQKSNHRYVHQRILVVKWNKYIYCVPYVEEKEYFFLKTIYPDRKLTKKYLKRRMHEK
jgi:uncharacterized DUF497 family protein